MYDGTRGLVRLRGAVLWGATTAAAAGVGWLALPAAAAARTARPGAGFTDLLVAGCALAALVATGGLWLITTEVVMRVLREGAGAAVDRPGRLRLLLLSACGVVALSATAAPAVADDSRPLAPYSLSGLPLPDRATGDASPRRDGNVEAAPAPTLVTVRPGDSLWSIAERRLGPRATVADVVGYWHRVYARNAAVIGPDPDLILPGQQLELPPV